MFRLQLFVLSLTLVTSSPLGASDGPILELPTGKILGRESTTATNRTYYAFEKIPYATPPVGDLRFKPSQPALSWEGTLDATKLDVRCYQPDQGLLSIFDSEDCLYLNVYTPKLLDEDNSLPVMLWIHGGGFTMGSSMFTLPDLFISNEVILVTINYRLGPFGFLSTEDEVISGNNGLKDQHLAIQWTHDNIHLFGGNPEKITIFGESAGAGSVAFHLLNQNSDGLFQGAILESGTALCPWALQRNSRSTAFGIASALNSNFTDSDDSKDLLLFLQSVDAKDLNDAAANYQNGTYAPVIEAKSPDAFITKKMYGLLKAGNFVKVPTMLGFNSEEAIALGTFLEATVQFWDDNLASLIPEDMQIHDPNLREEVGFQIRDIYTNGEPFGNNTAAAIRFSSDNTFNRGVIKFAEFLSKHTKTYFYQFSYNGELGNVFGTKHYDGAEDVGHTEEMSYLFCSGTNSNFDQYPESDRVTSKRLIKLWTDFAKFRNPTLENSDLLQNVTWPQVNIENGDFFYLNINETLEIRNHPKEKSYQKWVDIYNSLDFQDFDTY